MKEKIKILHFSEKLHTRPVVRHVEQCRMTGKSKLTNEKRKGEVDCMKNVVLDEVKKKLNWKERIIVRIFKNIFMKVYEEGKISYYNYLYKK